MVEIFSPFISLVSSKIADNKLNEVPIFFFSSRFVSTCKNVGSKDVGTNILTPPPYVRDSVGLVCTKCTLSTGKQTNPWFITLAPRKYTSDNISFEVVVRGEARFSKRKGVSFSFLSLSLSLILAATRFSSSFSLSRVSLPLLTRSRDDLQDGTRGTLVGLLDRVYDHRKVNQ